MSALDYLPLQPIQCRENGLLTRRIDIVGAQIARPADQGLLAHIGLDQARVNRVDQCQGDYTPDHAGRLTAVLRRAARSAMTESTPGRSDP
jgi:hypothetical protein